MSADPNLPETRLSRGLDRLVRRVGDAASWLWLVLLGVVVLNVVLRYLFGEGRIEFEEIQWHLYRSEEHTSELQSRTNLVCRLLLEKKKNTPHPPPPPSPPPPPPTFSSSPRNSLFAVSPSSLTPIYSHLPSASLPTNLPHTPHPTYLISLSPITS
mgnify:CR=1 FL=1